MATLDSRTQSELFNYVQGSDITGQSAYDIWKGLGYEGSEADFLEFIRTGIKGDTGKSAYEEWVEQSENVGKSYTEYLQSIRGADGKSAYEVWQSISENAGKTVEEFIQAIKGEKGNTGATGPQGDAGKNANEITIDHFIMKDVSTGENYKVIIKDGQIIIEKVEVEINEDNAAEVLQDFTYTLGDDGIYEITGWKGTYLGEPSTRCVVPDSSKIRI